MKIKFEHVNELQKIDAGWTLNENYNETLDNATIRISHLSNELDIEPLDQVELLQDDGVTHYRYMCIDDFNCIQEAIGQEDTTYSYTINLCSETKKMEGIVLPNLSITPRKKVRNPLKIYEVMDNYRKLYGPVEDKVDADWSYTTPLLQPEPVASYYLFDIPYTDDITDLKFTVKSFNSAPVANSYSVRFLRLFEDEKKARFELTASFPLGTTQILFNIHLNVDYRCSKWTYTNRVKTKFNDTYCPEMQWSNPTFREVITDLAMLKDCIPVLRNNVIDYIDLTTINPVTKPYNYVTKSKTSDDCVSEIRMELQNVMQTNVENINNVVTTSEYLTFTSDDSVITSDNCYLKTQFPILNIKHLWLICGSGNSSTTMKFLKIDLCATKAEWSATESALDKTYSLVCERKEYDNKDIAYRKNVIIATDVASKTIGGYFSKYQNFCVYFVRNTNKIEGFSRISKPVVGGVANYEDTTTLQYLKSICAKNNEALGQVNSAVFYGINQGDNSYFSTFFQIEYETTYNAVFSASKSDRPRNNRVIADNQTNAWVDAYSQGFLEYQKANRLGNLQKMYNQRVFDINNLYVIGDQVNDDIVFRTEYQFYPDHIECNALATKNYVLRNYFTGIKSKVRTWVNAREEAFIRHDLKKYYCEFSYDPYDEYIESVNEDHELGYYLLTPFNSRANPKPIKYALVKTQARSSSWPSDYLASRYALNCITRLIGDSIVLTTGFDDNWVIDKKINTGDRESDSYWNTAIIEKGDISDWNQDSNLNVIPPHIDLDFDSIISGILKRKDQVGGIATQINRYCNDDGEFDTISIHFQNELKTTSHNLDGDHDNSEIKDIYYSFYNLPIVNVSNNYEFGVSMTILKDNKEKPVISTQFEFLKQNNSNISFTKLFLERQEMISSASSQGAITLYLSNQFNETNLPNNAIEQDITDFHYQSDNDYRASIWLDGQPSGYCYVCDGDENVILVFDASKTLYLNIRRYM